MRAVLFLLFVSLLFGSGSVQAQSSVRDIQDEPLHWAFASLMGTGWYRVDGSQRTFIYQHTFRQTLRESSLSPGGDDRTIGINIRYDGTIGIHSIGDLLDFPEADDFSTLSFSPGIEFDIPINEDWYLRPFANVGGGTALDADVWAWLFYGGVKSRYFFDKEKQWALLNGLYYAGFDPNEGRSQDMTGLFTGVEYTHPLSRLPGYGHPVNMHWQLGYDYFVDSAQFGLGEDGVQPLESAWQLGLSISRSDRPFRIWFVEFDRLGLTYSIGEGGKFRAITLVTEAWFDK